MQFLSSSLLAALCYFLSIQTASAEPQNGALSTASSHLASVSSSLYAGATTSSVGAKATTSGGTATTTKSGSTTKSGTATSAATATKSGNAAPNSVGEAPYWALGLGMGMVGFLNV